MKRDFKEEYQDYIESDMPDLWSRIEPNLREKKVIAKEPAVKEPQPDVKESQPAVVKQRTGKKKGSLHLIKMMIPVAAGFCVLLIGVGVMELQNGMQETCTEVAEEPMEEEAAASDEAPIEMEEAAETEASAESIRTEETAGEAEASDDNATNAMTDQAPTAIKGSDESIDIERAVLSKISVAPEGMQENGYAYMYTFRLDDNSNILVYLTREQCEMLEKQGIEMERQKAYALCVSPLDAEKSEGSTSEKEYFLQKIEKLP